MQIHLLHYAYYMLRDGIYVSLLVQGCNISTHTNHALGVDESKHLPLPNSVKESMRIKLQDQLRELWMV